VGPGYQTRTKVWSVGDTEFSPMQEFDLIIIIFAQQ
jgi:hypothetical protein